MPPDERKFAGLLVRTIVEHGSALDDELADVTTNWRLERLGVIDRCVLRLAAAEFSRAKRRRASSFKRRCVWRSVTAR